MSQVGTAQVLIAEDDLAFRTLVAGALRRDGHRVRTVSDGRALLEAARAEAPDLIVTDEHMPELFGLQAVRELRSEGSSAPVVVITSFADPDVQEAARKLGRCVVLAKPVDLGVLRAAVRAALGEHTEG